MTIDISCLSLWIIWKIKIIIDLLRKYNERIKLVEIKLNVKLRDIFVSNVD
jgi:hypothetical protein